MPPPVLLLFFVNMGGWFVDVFVEYLFRVSFRGMKLLRSRNWPVTKGTVISVDCPPASYGCAVATVYYEYFVDGDKYEAYYEKPFLSHGWGAAYAAHFVKGMDFKVRFKPEDHSISAPCPQINPVYHPRHSA